MGGGQQQQGPDCFQQHTSGDHPSHGYQFPDRNYTHQQQQMSDRAQEKSPGYTHQQHTTSASQPMSGTVPRQSADDYFAQQTPQQLQRRMSFMRRMRVWAGVPASVPVAPPS